MTQTETFTLYQARARLIEERLHEASELLRCIVQARDDGLDRTLDALIRCGARQWLNEAV